MANKVDVLAKGHISVTTSGTAETLLTTLTAKDYIIDYIMIFNQHTSAVTIYLYQVNDSALVPGTLAATDEFFEYALAAKETVLLSRQDIMIVMPDTGDTIQAYASVADKLNYWIYGMKLADQ